MKNIKYFIPLMLIPMLTSCGNQSIYNWDLVKEVAANNCVSESMFNEIKKEQIQISSVSSSSIVLDNSLYGTVVSQDGSGTICIHSLVKNQPIVTIDSSYGVGFSNKMLSDLPFTFYYANKTDNQRLVLVDFFGNIILNKSGLNIVNKTPSLSLTSEQILGKVKPVLTVKYWNDETSKYVTSSYYYDDAGNPVEYVMHSKELCGVDLSLYGGEGYLETFSDYSHLSFAVYDKDLKLSKIISPTFYDSLGVSTIQVFGNKVFCQETYKISDQNSEKFDFYQGNYKYNLHSVLIDINSGTYQDVDFPYLVFSSDYAFNKNKKAKYMIMDSEKLPNTNSGLHLKRYIVDENLNVYSLPTFVNSSLTKVGENYLYSNNLFDKDFNLLSSLGDCYVQGTAHDKILAYSLTNNDEVGQSSFGVLNSKGEILQNFEYSSVIASNDKFTFVSQPSLGYRTASIYDVVSNSVTRVENVTILTTNGFITSGDAEHKSQLYGFGELLYESESTIPLPTEMQANIFTSMGLPFNYSIFSFSDGENKVFVSVPYRKAVL